MCLSAVPEERKLIEDAKIMDTNVNTRGNQMFWTYRSRDVACSLELFKTTASKSICGR